MSMLFRSLAPAVAGSLAFVPMAAAAQSTQAELYIDVATHSAPGMPGMGAAGRLAARMGGVDQASYGMARHPSMPGKYLDVALHNNRQPGTPARQAIPDGALMGPHLELLPPAERIAAHGHSASGANPYGQADGARMRILYYWGCGTTVAAGQPLEFTVEVRDGTAHTSGGAMTPRQVPQAGINAGPEYALWPNRSNPTAVPAGASLRGSHEVTGDALPADLRFELQQAHDFMPALQVERRGSASEGLTLDWQPVDGARAYFLHAMGSRGGDTMVMWSSSEVGNAGPELFDYLPNAQLEQWTREQVLLDADARSCSIPREAFAAQGAETLVPVVQMIAYGGEDQLAQPRPAGAGNNWTPEWNVRVRNKSTAMLMPGVDAAVPDARDVVEQTGRESVKDAARGLLRGILGR